MSGCVVFQPCKFIDSHTKNPGPFYGFKLVGEYEVGYCDTMTEEEYENLTPQRALDIINESYLDSAGAIRSQESFYFGDNLIEIEIDDDGRCVVNK